MAELLPTVLGRWQVRPLLPNQEQTDRGCLAPSGTEACTVSKKEVAPSLLLSFCLFMISSNCSRWSPRMVNSESTTSKVALLPCTLEGEFCWGWIPGSPPPPPPGSVQVVPLSFCIHYCQREVRRHSRSRASSFLDHLFPPLFLCGSLCSLAVFLYPCYCAVSSHRCVLPLTWHLVTLVNLGVLS